MKCFICGKSNEKSVCSHCENKKRCKVCNILKTDFYKYKNGKLYSTCIECFNKKVKCEFCNKEFNKTYLLKHLIRCIKLLEDIYYLNNNQIMMIMKIKSMMIIIKLIIIKLMMIMKIIIIKLIIIKLMMIMKIIIIKLIIIVIGH